MGKPKAPCKDCPDRHPCCWDSCEKYRAFVTANELHKENIRNGKKEDHDWKSVIFSHLK